MIYTIEQSVWHHPVHKIHECTRCMWSSVCAMYGSPRLRTHVRATLFDSAARTMRPLAFMVPAEMTERIRHI